MWGGETQQGRRVPDADAEVDTGTDRRLTHWSHDRQRWHGAPVRRDRTDVNRRAYAPSLPQVGGQYLTTEGIVVSSELLAIGARGSHELVERGYRYTE